MFLVTTFSTWLQSELDSRGWSQSDLARASQTSPGTISNLITGLRQPGDDLCRAIASAFKMPQWRVFLFAGLLTEPPVSKNELDSTTEHFINRVMALPPEKRERVLALSESIADALDQSSG
jgi:transcriptional regulator with XRE-family HTH domain